MTHDHRPRRRTTTTTTRACPTTCRSWCGAASGGAGCSASSAASASPRSPAARSATTARRPAQHARPPGAVRAARWRAAGRRDRRASPTSRSPTARSPRRPPGPYPGDGSNGPNVLTESGVVRSDITSQLRLGVRGGRGRAADPAAQGLRPGRRGRDGAGRRRALPVALRPRGQLLDVRRGRSPTRTTCAACRRPTRTGGGVHDDLPRLLRRALAAHPLRGLRASTSATSASNKLRTSQLAFPEDVCTRSTRPTATSRASPTCPRRQPRLRRHLQRRLLAADGQGHRLGRRRLRRHPQRPGLTGRPPLEGVGIPLRRTTRPLRRVGGRVPPASWPSPAQLNGDVLREGRSPPVVRRRQGSRSASRCRRTSAPRPWWHRSPVDLEDERGRPSTSRHDRRR